MGEFGTYSKDDVVFLLKDISNLINEECNKEREMKIQSGTHYSEMIPIEYNVSEKYLNLYYEKLKATKEKLAFAVGVMSEKIVKKNGFDVVLVSLARAGIPIGILAKRYLKEKYNMNLPHYSISIIRDKGIDMNAIDYILKVHPNSKIQFIDGWTGKGTICKELDKACEDLKLKYNMEFDSTLAVLADPAGYSGLYGVRDDFLIPSACLNSTVSGLVSRTVLNKTYIGTDDFHGAKFYRDLLPADVSNEFIHLISTEFSTICEEAADISSQKKHEKIETGFLGMQDVMKIQAEFAIENTHYIKPGVGETTRVLLRRVPWKILMRDPSSPFVKHILMLAEEKGVEVVEYPELRYLCCGIIKSVKENKK